MCVSNFPFLICLLCFFPLKCGPIFDIDASIAGSLSLYTGTTIKFRSNSWIFRFPSILFPKFRSLSLNYFPWWSRFQKISSISDDVGSLLRRFWSRCGENSEVAKRIMAELFTDDIFTNRGPSLFFQILCRFSIPHAPFLFLKFVISSVCRPNKRNSFLNSLEIWDTWISIAATKFSSKSENNAPISVTLFLEIRDMSHQSRLRYFAFSRKKS